MIREVKKHNIVIFSIFFKIKLCCVYSLELSHQGDSYKYTEHTVLRKNKRSRIIPNIINICSYGKKFQGLKNNFKKAVVNEPSEFEPSEIFCILKPQKNLIQNYMIL